MDNDIINPDVEEPQKPDLKKDFAHYKMVLAYMGANVPIEVLCLPKPIENNLRRNGFYRVYDLINHDLTKIKGLGKARVDLLASSLDEFFSISL